MKLVKLLLQLEMLTYGVFIDYSCETSHDDAENLINTKHMKEIAGSSTDTLWIQDAVTEGSVQTGTMLPVHSIFFTESGKGYLLKCPTDKEEVVAFIWKKSAQGKLVEKVLTLSETAFLSEGKPDYPMLFVQASVLKNLLVGYDFEVETPLRYYEPFKLSPGEEAVLTFLNSHPSTTLTSLPSKPPLDATGSSSSKKAVKAA